MHPGFDPTSLAIFTTLAPGGAVCVVVLAVVLLICPYVDAEARERLNHLFAIPIFVTWAGFIASATHLGTPANALYVFSRVGASPLSNEVTGVVLFLFFSGVFWLLSFRENFPLGAQKALLILCAIAACVMVFLMGFAYNVDTVPTWHTMYTPVNLILVAMIGGFSLSCLVLELGRYSEGIWIRRLLIAAFVLVVLTTIALLFYVNYLSAFENNVTTVAGQTPMLWINVALFALVSLVGLAIQWMSRTRLEGIKHVLGTCLGCATVFAGIFFVRLLFYSIYLPVGF